MLMRHKLFEDLGIEQIGKDFAPRWLPIEEFLDLGSGLREVGGRQTRARPAYLNQIIRPVTPMMMVPQTTAQYSIFSA